MTHGASTATASLAIRTAGGQAVAVEAAVTSPFAHHRSKSQPLLTVLVVLLLLHAVTVILAAAIVTTTVVRIAVAGVVAVAPITAVVAVAGEVWVRLIQAESPTPLLSLWTLMLS